VPRILKEADPYGAKRNRWNRIEKTIATLKRGKRMGKVRNKGGKGQKRELKHLSRDGEE